jgi:hypothetical protein
MSATTLAGHLLASLFCPNPSLTRQGDFLSCPFLSFLEKIKSEAVRSLTGSNLLLPVNIKKDM